VIAWPETLRRAAGLLRRVGLDEHPRTRVADIGVSKQQLVEIAKALAKDVGLLILDEPTAALNDEDSAQLLELIRELKSQGITSIIISHKLNEIARVADSVTILRDGRTVETLDLGAPETTEERIIRGMVGRSLDNRFPDRTPRTTPPAPAPALEIRDWTVGHPGGPPPHGCGAGGRPGGGRAGGLDARRGRPPRSGGPGAPRDAARTVRRRLAQEVLELVQAGAAPAEIAARLRVAAPVLLPGLGVAPQWQVVVARVDWGATGGQTAAAGDIASGPVAQALLEEILVDPAVSGPDSADRIAVAHTGEEAIALVPLPTATTAAPGPEEGASGEAARADVEVADARGQGPGRDADARRASGRAPRAA
ncbi:hypothetical protein ACFWJY_43220, partial [Streptomyces anulatus]